MDRVLDFMQRQGLAMTRSKQKQTNNPSVKHVSDCI